MNRLYAGILCMAVVFGVSASSGAEEAAATDPEKFEELFTWRYDQYRRLAHGEMLFPSSHTDDYDQIGLSSSAKRRAAGPDFEHMVAMGETVAPLALFRALGNHFALQIYDSIMATRPDLRDTDALDGEQLRVIRTARLWLSRQR